MTESENQPRQQTSALTAILGHSGAPAALIVIYWGTLSLLGDLRSDHWLMGGAIIGLSYTGTVARRIRNFILPLILTGMVYDGKRFFANDIRGRIRVEEPYLFDQTFFGIRTDQGILTPPEWWQLHTHPVLDVVCGLFYVLFIAAFVVFSAYFVFYRSRIGTATRSAAYVAARAPLMMWSFFWVNVVGYSTYFWYPAAPPWYVAQYGLGPAILGTRPYAAGALRFDELFGVTLFQNMYSKGADVFGAVPSLHCAYPAIAVYWAFRFGQGRVFALIYWLGMCFSAVYLNHHWVLDALWGSAYAFTIPIVVERLAAKQTELRENA